MSTLVMYNNSRAQKEDSVNTQYREYNESYIFFKLSTLNSYFSFFLLQHLYKQYHAHAYVAACYLNHIMLILHEQVFLQELLKICSFSEIFNEPEGICAYAGMRDGGGGQSHTRAFRWSILRIVLKNVFFISAYDFLSSFKEKSVTRTFST